MYPAYLGRQAIEWTMDAVFEWRSKVGFDTNRPLPHHPSKPGVGEEAFL